MRSRLLVLACALLLLPVQALADAKEKIAALAPSALALAVDENGNELVAQNADKPFVPASVAKIATAWLAMEVLGGGYRFPGGHALSMHVTRQPGQHGLGLAVRYDWHQSYLRLGYESPLRSHGLPDRLRFSAGLRF